MNQPAISATGSPFSRFMASTYGRATRAALGLTVVATGLLLVPWPAGLALATVGIVPIIAGVFNLCPVAPLWGGHFMGSRYCPSRTQASGN